MDQSLREKIALVAFVALVSLFIGIIIGYLNVGHSWNSTATAIDEQRGDMEGYTAIVYSGKGIPEAQNGDKGGTISVDALANSYRSKSCCVLKIDSLDPRKYEGDDIFYQDGKRFGVFYQPLGTSESWFIERCEYFATRQVDYTICITENSDIAQMHPEAVDVVICLDREEWVGSGTTLEGSYFARVPVVGRIGAVIISPEGVVSSKDATEL